VQTEVTPHDVRAAPPRDLSQIHLIFGSRTAAGDLLTRALNDRSALSTNGSPTERREEYDERVYPRSRALLVAALLSIAGPAAARLKHRVPTFEPTDLDLEDTHTLELDLQFGVVFRDDAPRTRVFVPDFELDYGLTERVELNVDGAFSVADVDGHPTGFVDPLWTCVKLGFLSKKDDNDPKRVYALGAQLGPRLPTGAHLYGTGFGAVLLGARMHPPWHVILTAGGVLEPLDRTQPRRSAAVLGGVDLDYDLDRADRFSLMAELGGAYSLGPDPNDVHATLGLDFVSAPWLDLSLVGFYGFLPGGDRGGIFLGFAPKLPLDTR